MKKIYRIQIIFLIAVSGLFFACTNKNQFAIEGNITDGAGKILYFENITASSIVLLDSVRLDKSGSFKFKHLKPVTPDFYRLRLKHQFINVSVDSTETIKIQADTLNFARNYTVEGSAESVKIKELALLQLTTNEAYNKLQRQYNSLEISADEYVGKVKELTTRYKEIAKTFIYDSPVSASAYFALFQQINNLLIFDPYDKTDSKAYGAVANNWNLLYPEAPRTQHLVALFKQSLAVLRGEHPSNRTLNEIESKAYFDISLPSLDDKTVRLSEAGAGKFVLLDFIAYEMENSPAHNVLLANIYKKHYTQGFLIYQVSLDRDRHFWKNAAVNLPWVCVIDPESVGSAIAKKYNVADIPTGFILNREGEIVARIDNYNDLEKELEKYIK